MDEYIKREAAIKSLLNDSPEQVGYSREDAADCIRYMDAADVVSVRWKPVFGYEGLYEVNQFGQIRNKDGQIMRQRLKKAKYTVYKKVSLYKDGKYKHLYVHRIVAQAFIPNPQCFDLINHKDEDGTNNVVDNLEWCDRSYNASYGTSPKKISKAFKGRESEKRIAVYATNKNGDFVGEWDSITEAAKDVGCSTSEISGALKGKRKNSERAYLELLSLWRNNGFGGLNMTHEDFKTCLEELDGQGAKTLAEKNARYSSSDDALHNFKMGAEVMGGTSAQACWGYMTKHLVALRDMIQRNDFSNREDVLEKIQDSINYLRFIWAISEEERSKYISSCESANVKTLEGYGECDSCLYADKTELEEPCKTCRNNFGNGTSEYYHAPLLWTPKTNI